MDFQVYFKVLKVFKDILDIPQGMEWNELTELHGYLKGIREF